MSRGFPIQALTSKKSAMTAPRLTLMSDSRTRPEGNGLSLNSSWSISRSLSSSMRRRMRPNRNRVAMAAAEYQENRWGWTAWILASRMVKAR